MGTLEHLGVVLQQMFLNSSADEKFGDVMTLTKAYHKYKREYVKHASFNPGEENLSKNLFLDGDSKVELEAHLIKIKSN